MRRALALAPALCRVACRPASREILFPLTLLHFLDLGTPGLPNFSNARHGPFPKLAAQLSQVWPRVLPAALLLRVRLLCKELCCSFFLLPLKPVPSRVPNSLRHSPLPLPPILLSHTQILLKICPALFVTSWSIPSVPSSDIRSAHPQFQNPPTITSIRHPESLRRPGTAASLHQTFTVPHHHPYPYQPIPPHNLFFLLLSCPANTRASATHRRSPSPASDRCRTACLDPSSICPLIRPSSSSSPLLVPPLSPIPQSTHTHPLLRAPGGLGSGSSGLLPTLDFSFRLRNAPWYSARALFY
ncbi:hypothetical protein B0I35DRAFT_247508 [Stachybotrys elegans]|uniref:Uncharacterized protein n=1 Tax=Stachybotrys elegans TaxID=80388 RepID=A0A8K0WSK1_9HYPO|nr:hypothetical protein B0I35DRAFT_247508 [Stachybotrys elegans]